MKRTILWLSALFLFFSVPLFAREGIPGKKLVDNGGLLSGEAARVLEDRLELIAANRGFDLVIVTEKDIGRAKPMNYADDFFDYNGYGRGQNRDGCLFLLVSGSRDYWFSTSGRGIDILNPSAYAKLERDVLKYLRLDDYSGAFLTFARDWEEFLALDTGGRRYNFFHERNVFLTAIAWLLSFGIACLVVRVWKSRMNTALSETQAGAYIVPGSLNFTLRKDSFLYSRVSKTMRQTETSSSGGGSHSGSSGRSHGGGGGKY